jgi:hypothetical protein
MGNCAHFTDSLSAVRGDGSMPISTRYDGVNGMAGSGTQSKEFEGNA